MMFVPWGMFSLSLSSSLLFLTLHQSVMIWASPARKLASASYQGNDMNLPISTVFLQKFQVYPNNLEFVENYS